MSTQDLDKDEQDAIEVAKLIDSMIPPTRYKSFIYRLVNDVSKASMGVHPLPAHVPYRKSTFEGTDFYHINGAWWQLGTVSSDDLGIFVEFYRMEGEFKGYSV